MANLINRNDPRTQLSPVIRTRPLSTFFRDHFMGGPDEYFDTEYVEWDHVLNGAPMARYVGEDMYVEPTERSPFKTNEIQTPIFQERRIISVKDINKRMPGENIYSPRSDAERSAELFAEDVKFCLNSIDSRIELECAQFITTGVIPIVGEGVNREVDYGLPNREILTGGDCFGQPGVDIISKMSMIVDYMGQLGHTVDEVIMSPEVWQVIYMDSTIQKLLENRRYEFGVFKPEQASKYGAAKPVGMLTEPHVTLYTQNAEYGGKNNRHRYLPKGMMIFGSSDARKNKLGYGAVTYKDEEKIWHTVAGRYIQQFFNESRRPPRDELLVTSRAIPIPYNVESWYTLFAIEV